jgi:hypothetical protein
MAKVSKAEPGTVAWVDLQAPTRLCGSSTAGCSAGRS